MNLLQVLLTKPYCCNYGPDLFPLPLVRTSLVADGEALGQQCLCAGHETLQRGEERQGPTSPRAALLYVLPHPPRGWCQHCCSLCGGLGDQCLVWARHKIFSYSFARNFARTEKLPVKGVPGYTSALPSIPFPSHSCLVLHTPALRWLGGNNTPGGDFRGCLRKRISSYFRLSGEEDPAKLQLSGLKNWVQISPCISYIPARAVPTRLLCYCCSSHLSHRPGSPRPKLYS